MTDRELMQQALDALTCAVPFGWSSNYVNKHRAATEALRTRLAQPEPEPVAWLYKKKDGMQVITDDPDYADGTWIPLYTAQPNRTPLTGKQMNKAFFLTDTDPENGFGNFMDGVEFAEISHGIREKNND